MIDPSTKRVALCLSGQARAAKFCYSSIWESVVKLFGQVDVFIHSWLTDSSPGAFDIKYTNFFDCSTAEYIDLYKPVSCVLEDFRRSDLLKYNSVFEKYKIMYYSIYKSNELRKHYEIRNDIKYDYVIRCRTDLFFLDKILDEHLDGLNDDSVLIPKGSIMAVGYAGICDQFAIGTSSAMNKYCSMYGSLDCKASSQIVSSERLLQYYLHSTGMSVQNVDLDYFIVKK